MAHLSASTEGFAQDAVDFANNLLAEISTNSLPGWEEYKQDRIVVQDDHYGTSWVLHFEEDKVAWYFNPECGVRLALTYEQLEDVPLRSMLTFIETVTEADCSATLSHEQWISLKLFNSDLWEVEIPSVVNATLLLHRHQLVAWLSSLLATAQIWATHKAMQE